MADSDKNIIIRPNRGATGSTAQPQIRFVGQNNDPITLRVLDMSGSSAGTLSFEGSAGQLFAISNALTSGSLFSVNDISGLPSIDVNANGTILFAGFTGNVGIGATAGISGSTYRLTVIGSEYVTQGLMVGAGISITGGANLTGGARVFGGVTFGNDIYAPNMVTGVNGITGAVSITSGSNITITQSGKTITIASAGGGGGSSPLATSSVTGVASFPDADFSVSAVGAVSLTGNVARTHVGQSFTGLQVFSSGLSSNGITGTILTPSQSNITSLGSLTTLTTAGLTSTQRVTISSGGLSVVGNIDGTIGTAAQPNITSVGTLTSLNTAGMTSTQRVTISSGGLSVVGNIDGTIGTATQTNITSLGSLTTLTTAGLTSTQRVNVSAGGIVVQADGLSVTGGANLTGGSTFFGDIEVYDGAFIRTGGLSVTGGIAGTLVTPAQTNITSLGTLTSLTTSGLLSAQALNVLAGATFGADIYAPNMVTGVNGITGAVEITAGANVTITQTGKTITIASSGGGGGGGVSSFNGLTGDVTGVSILRGWFL